MIYLKEYESGIHKLHGQDYIVRSDLFKKYSNFPFNKRDIDLFKLKFIKSKSHDFFLPSKFDNKYKISVNFKKPDSPNDRSICLIFYKLGDEYYLCIVKHKNIKYLIDTYEDLIEFIDDLPNLYDTIYF